MTKTLDPRVASLVARGALFAINHSGGKDSQAMFHFVRAHVPAEQIIVIHAMLPGVEWEGVEEHIRDTILGMPLVTCRARRTFLEMVAERGMFPSPAQRQCTSDLKRDPIEKVLRNTGAKLIVNCMGMRAQESPKRRQLETLKLNKRMSKAGRECYDWLPIHELLVEQVFAAIAAAGQKPHWAYAAGMSRLSCCFCVMGSKADLITAAKLNPELYATIVALERSTGRTMQHSKKHGQVSLETVTGIKAVFPIIPLKLAA